MTNWDFFGRNDAKAETPVLWPPHAKSCVGDIGNDYIAGLAFKTGQDCNGAFEWEFPSGAKLTMACVVNVTNPGGGESNAVDGLECDVMSNGKPAFTPADTTTTN